MDNNHADETRKHVYHTGVITKAHRQANSNAILVFGSNLAGRHGAGAALEAYKHWSATYGIGEGPTGWAYAIPTKDEKLNTLSLDEIQSGVDTFLFYAHMRTPRVFLVTAIGTGLAGLTHEQIAPMFAHAPLNCLLPPEWQAILEPAPVNAA